MTTAIGPTSNLTADYWTENNLCRDDDIYSHESVLCRNLLFWISLTGFLFNLFNLAVILNLSQRSNFQKLLTVMSINDIIISIMVMVFTVKELQKHLVGKPITSYISTVVAISHVFFAHALLWLSVLDRYNALCRCFVYKSLFVTRNWKLMIFLTALFFYVGFSVSGAVYYRSYCVNGISFPDIWRKTAVDKKSRSLSAVFGATSMVLMLSTFSYMAYKIQQEMRRTRQRETALRYLPDQIAISFEVTNSVKRILISYCFALIPAAILIELQHLVPAPYSVTARNTMYFLFPLGPILNTVGFITNNKPYWKSARNLLKKMKVRVSQVQPESA